MEIILQQCLFQHNMIASTQITDTDILAFMAVLVSKLLNRKVLFINTKDNENC